MYAVVDDRNQQFRAEPGQRVQLPHNESWEPGSTVTFDKVCLVTGEQAQVGAPYVDGVSVTATVVGMACPMASGYTTGQVFAANGGMYMA